MKDGLVLMLASTCALMAAFVMCVGGLEYAGMAVSVLALVTGAAGFARRDAATERSLRSGESPQPVG